MRDLGTETAFEAAARARALEATGVDVIHLEIGEPDFDTPVNMREAAKRALDAGWTHYGPPLGPARVARCHRRRPEHPGAGWPSTRQRGRHAGRQADHVLRDHALAGPGDEVIYPDPGFPIYESMASFVGARRCRSRSAKPTASASTSTSCARWSPTRTKLHHLQQAGQPDRRCARPRRPRGHRRHRHRARHPGPRRRDLRRASCTKGEHISIASLPGMAERTIMLDGFRRPMP